MLGSLILSLKGMRIMMFQLSGFYYTSFRTWHALYGGLVMSATADGQNPALPIIRNIP